MRYIRPVGTAANLSWVFEDPVAISAGSSTNISWYSDPTLRFIFDEGFVDETDITFLFENETFSYSPSVDLVFSGAPFTSNPINLVFGEEGDEVTLAITGAGSVLVPITSSSTGEMSPIGNSNVSVSIDLVSSGVVRINGAGGVPVAITTTGSGTNISYADIMGSSSIVVSIDTVATGTKEIYGNSNIAVDILVASTGTKEIFGASNIPVSITTTGSGAFSGGFEMFGSGTADVLVTSSSVAAVLNPIFGVSSTIVSIGVVGAGTSVMVYEDIFGHSSYTIEISTLFDADMVSDDRPLLIDNIEGNKDAITYEIDIVVDIDKRQYEIWKIQSNKQYLESVKRGKMAQTFELGTEVKDEFELIENPTEFYKTTRRVVFRKYGSSTINLQINISKGYRFIKNEVNTKRLVEREIDRAILDTYALYELEFE